MATDAQDSAWDAAATHQSTDLTEAECWTLLASRGTGRVAYQEEGRVLVFPVNYVVRDQSVYFRTARDGVLGGGAEDRNASFQIDDHDTRRMDGWSVLLSGRAAAVRDPELLTQLWGRRMDEPWGGGQRDVFIGIEPSTVTGRRVGMR
ncbi:nitroimidazol reductase NimA-like FMN-containing flavoprotein (pyridoxamine 5'-phosphate oxidase superfamily) [Arthrobacter sp. UYP6]|uniref:pyridoxamine 5'-phosphate oxidase family protein n=1 Tax=Arthrobacter sp. UYP6 TaxID=1756378 RepID=UPI003394206C